MIAVLVKYMVGTLMHPKSSKFCLYACDNKGLHNMDIRKKNVKDMDTNGPMTNTNMY